MSELCKWYRSAGIELTRIGPWEELAAIPKKIKKAAERLYPDSEEDQHDYIYENWKESYEDRRTTAIINKGEKWAAKKDFIHNFGSDPYCIEVSSVKLYDWKKCKQFFVETDAFLKTFKLLSFSEEICGTGGHVHIGIQNSREAMMVERLILNHPEAMFAFCHPCDEHHILKNMNKEDIDFNPTVYWNKNPYNTDYSADGYKDGPIAYRYNYSTMEFRMMDVAQTWEMQEEHVAFAQAFVEYALTHPQIILLYKDEMDKRTIQQHCDNFQKLIKKLNLPWSRYKWYQGNIRTRLKFRTKNFD
jgi:hypothetical protein